jgi:hypothetical protein
MNVVGLHSLELLGVDRVGRAHGALGVATSANQGLADPLAALVVVNVVVGQGRRHRVVVDAVAVNVEDARVFVHVGGRARLGIRRYRRCSIVVRVRRRWIGRRETRERHHQDERSHGSSR